MVYTLAADLIVIIHAAFVLFVVFGGLLVLRWRRLAAVHLIAVFWGALVEFAGLICPLTPLENQFRELAREAIYHDDFINHYITELLYPAGLTRRMQIALGATVLIVNGAVYGRLLALISRRRVSGK